MPPVRTYHHGNLRAALLESAEQTLAEGGEISLRELARKVGVSHAAPRRHFFDKQELLDELALDGFRRLGAQLAEALAGEDPLAAWARTYVRFATEHAALLELMFAGKHRSRELMAASHRCFSPAFALFESERTGVVAFATLHGLAGLINSGMLAAERLDEHVSDAIEQIRRGLVV
ncbi:TetR/AcrR family transcriptional regulator [Solirubrobacter sp. CPCC 204708]|uniref:TetR/AcrR family transcriptional regulator n=1 Tax=Solirubrobacter deserti TaxID=2282478 RepID=A0ABT4RCU0_9ACTN|nr:TetR/AcrR family transcriptional regulator [Solirubrobacter deserti]MBE2317859.1 TetR/AcrR family transcriptional regulator [Solirubrobacter deserti]MDA0136364.1 TetR/AcrR family transcriptional regulator [Solirubrobacter deserti]